MEYFAIMNTTNEDGGEQRRHDSTHGVTAPTATAPTATAPTATVHEPSSRHELISRFPVKIAKMDTE
jgi:hypothetical protein